MNQSVDVPTEIVPIVIKTNLVGLAINNNGIIGTVPGTTVFDPSAANSACLAPPNDVPLTLFEESPIFQSASFTFGGTNVGDTQYLDAFQRANFWSFTKGHDYHVKLDPVTITSPVFIDVPDADGLALATTSLGPPAFCAPLGIIDINWFDAYLNIVVISSLASQGVNAGSLPIFLLANVVMASPVADIAAAFLATTAPRALKPTHRRISTQPASSDPPFSTPVSPPTKWASGWMTLWAATRCNRGDMSDKWGVCQTNLEVGDPLTGLDVPNVTMPSGYSYHLQELAFFSWFYGAPSIAVNGWWSDNDTFTTNEGPPCR